MFVAGGGKCVEVFGGGELESFQAGFGAGAAEDEDEVIRRAGAGAEVLEFVGDELFEALRIEQRLGFLVEKHFVGGAATFGDEEKFVLRTLGGVEVDLGGEIGAGVDLFPKVERSDLGVAEVFLGVAVVDAATEPFGIIGSGPDLLAFFSEDGGRAGVLAHRENTARGDLGVFEEGEGDVAVVGAGGGVVLDGGDLLDVFRAEEKRRVVKGVLGEVGESLGRDFEDFPAFKGRGAHTFFGEEAVNGVVGTEGQRVLINEGGRGHR